MFKYLRLGVSQFCNRISHEVEASKIAVKSLNTRLKYYHKYLLTISMKFYIINSVNFNDMDTTACENI